MKKMVILSIILVFALTSGCSSMGHKTTGTAGGIVSGTAPGKNP